MTPDPDFEDERFQPLDDVDPDRDRTVYDPETGEWLTITEAKEEADDYVRRRGPVVADQPIPEPEEEPGTVYDPETGEEISVEEARRRAESWATDDDVSVVVTRDDVGKPVRDEFGTEIGQVARVDAGTAYVEPHAVPAEGTEAMTDWFEAIKKKISWYVRGAEAYPIPPEHIDRVTDDYVQLKSFD
jgi:hypothetical protein